MAYGPGYTGTAAGTETIDLTEYAGQEILLRFEYVTDDATNLAGMAIDNIEIPEIGFWDRADGLTNRDLEGFRRVEGFLPQEFIVQVIDPDTGQAVRAELDSNNYTELQVVPGDIIAVSAVTRGTTEAGRYRWLLQ
jgi:hypothetical protein